MCGCVGGNLPHSKKSANIYAMKVALDIIYNYFFRSQRESQTVIIRNSSPWLTRLMTGSFERYTHGYHLPWLQSRPLRYIVELQILLDFMKIMTNSTESPIKFRFWCVEPEANREAMDLAQRVYIGSRNAP
ncbi:hypothetical protein M441DRAFT_138878 [Trichoderma asperellum CBS 433.97]|uniref:RNase H type-1 domain-containing protein n=2 Tax=Trichoderma asperellum TaxID=101201 RepID=A0A2T3ZA96_TRIA4|nr:hypothetical protein M441DRAFT_138878 [Trichoderma asperellum CBS 433.97]PTB41725.1 hypothetical protein M441DRAFT_138878 [Trichoderma asperellum CBS 433.97]